MLGLVLTPVTIHHHGGGALFERLAERVGAGHRDRDGLHDARAAALLCAGISRLCGIVQLLLRRAISKGSIEGAMRQRGNGNCAKR